MDLSRAIERAALPRLVGDPTGAAAQRMDLQTVVVPVDGVEAPLAGVVLAGWFADRASVAIYDARSVSGGELRLRLVVANSCGVGGTPSEFQVAADRGVTLVAGVARTLEVFTGSGPLGSYWVLLGNMVNPGDDCRFTASMVLDRAGAGSYVVVGQGTKV